MPDNSDELGKFHRDLNKPNGLVSVSDMLTVQTFTIVELLLKGYCSRKLKVEIIGIRPF